ncbi:phage protease [Campylobacter fetus]|uniref:phage protease n=1 Tax=Campylobacter fetus TaxID=196 RepID=UPI000CFE0819|nr:phage protease [Campylobacter fetus]AVK80650.1 hypothetical protein C6B32_01965 [Campylobacter fetus subsp. testudinum]
MIKSSVLFALKSDTPNVIKLAVVGSWQGHRNGSFEITKADIEKMKNNFDKRQVDLVVDYEHQTLSGQVAPASGWIKELYITDDGSLMGTVEWTTKATEFIKNGEYKYISPVFNFSATSEKTGAYQGATLHSASLTNTPFLDELGEVVANKQEIKGEKMTETEYQESLATKDEEISKLKKERDELVANSKAKDELIANSKVEAAIANSQISLLQKDWAFTYCKKDPLGFEEFLKSGATLANVGANNMFANKKQPTSEIDLVKMALGE